MALTWSRGLQRGIKHRQFTFTGLKTNSFSTKNTMVRSTTASDSVVYESERAGHEYLQFHYGKPDDIMPYACAPADAMSFLTNAVHDTQALMPKDRRGRALEIGCAVGRSSFELSRYFDEVIGIDFSNHFIHLANEMKRKQTLQYEVMVQGDIRRTYTAHLPAGVQADKVHFQQGDACNLDLSALRGPFDLVFASNLLCRLPEPIAFLNQLKHFVHPNGIVALVSPYSWLEEYTAKEKWIGGGQFNKYTAATTNESFQVLQGILATEFELIQQTQYPFIIREHERKYQYGISDGTFWKRK